MDGGGGHNDANKHAADGKSVSAATAQQAIDLASAVSMELGVQMGYAQGHADGRAEGAAEHATDVVAMTVEHLITQVELEAEREAVAAITAASLAAERALEGRVATLQRQLQGGNWLDAVGKAQREAAAAQSKATSAERDQAKLKELMSLQQIGPRMRAKGGELLAALASEATVTAAGLEGDLAAQVPSSAADVNLTDRWVDQLAAYLEEQLFFAGKGGLARTKLLADALMKRAAMQRLVGRSDAKAARLSRAMTAMIESAAGVLAHLTTGKRGSRSAEDHLRFEAIVTALVPDECSQLELGRAVCELLGIHHEQLERALERRRTINETGGDGAFSRATRISRQIRADYRGWGRRVAVNYWHKATRLDTRLGQKKRHRETNPISGDVFYREH